MLFFIFLWLAIIFLLGELFLPGLLLFGCLSVSFLAVAFCSIWYCNWVILLAAWTIINIVSFLLLTHFIKKNKLNRTENAISTETNVTGMVGQRCLVSKRLANGYFLIMVEAEEWTAAPLNQNENFTEGEWVYIVRVVGNHVIIKK